MTDAERDARLKEFYDRWLQPLALRVRERGGTPFPMAPDSSVSSYYRLRQDDGRYVHSLPRGELAACLTALWSAGPLPELAELVSALLALAETLRQEDEPTGDVSPFVYAMF